MKHISNISQKPQVAAELTTSLKLGFISEIIDVVAGASAFKDDEGGLTPTSDATE